MPKKVFKIIAWGGLGDVLLSTPAFKAIKKKYPSCKIEVYCATKSHIPVFENNPYVDKVKRASFFANPVTYMQYYFKWAPFYDFFYGALHPGLFYDTSAKDLIAGLFDVELEDKNVQLFLTEAEEKKAQAYLAQYKNPIMVHTTSKCSKNQEWPVKYWEKLIQSMPDYTFIQLGLPVEYQLKNAVDARGKTTSREAFAYLKYAKGFVGVVSSLSHATNAFGTPGVVLFGASHPGVWGHPNNINLYKGVRCAPCIDLLAASECPYGAYCMSNITVEEVRAALLQQLQVNAPANRLVENHALWP
jgi:ADP-heptose:LPS heptosyltransferase